nr:DUF2975 domain-containing protein [uncultured Flavobacterium sp.]
MKNNNKLTTVLYVISRLAYRFAQLCVLSIVFFEFFTPSGEIGSISSSIHHSKGYPIKARIQLSLPDTLIIYKNKTLNSSGTIIKTDYKPLLNDFNKIKKDKQYDKTYQINEFNIYKNGFKDVNKKFNNLKIQNEYSEINLVINPKNIFFKSMLILKNYFMLAVLLFITYQCMHLFKQLRENFIFNKSLYQRIRNIGLSLITYEAVKIFVSIITMQNLSYINYQHYIPTIDNTRFDFMSLRPILDYNSESIFLGLCLIVLAKLLNYGYKLQNENELTI